jgi:dolichol-phosphate mannosyltransferase
MRISVVIPAFNEEGNIGRLIEETFAEVPETALGEVIAVDDASDDGTGAEIKALLGKYRTLRYVRHGQRAGQSAALRTGVLAARFPVIATMDGDGQNDPADIMKLARRLGSEGLEPAMAAGIRAGRKGPGSRKAASRFANFIRDKVLADGCPDTGCGIKLYRREAFLELPFFITMHRYLPALFLTYGHEIAYEAVNDRPRAPRRVEIYQSRPCPDWAIRSCWGKLAAQAHAHPADRRRCIGRRRRFVRRAGCRGGLKVRVKARPGE